MQQKPQENGIFTVLKVSIMHSEGKKYACSKLRGFLLNTPIQRTDKMVVRCISFWDGLFSEAMLVSGSVDLFTTSGDYGKVHEI